MQFYTNKYQKDIASSYGHKIECVDDMLFTILLIIEESKYCSDVMKKHFNKELVMTKEGNEDLRTLLNTGFLMIILLMVMLK